MQGGGDSQEGVMQGGGDSQEGVMQGGGDSQEGVADEQVLWLELFNLLFQLLYPLGGGKGVCSWYTVLVHTWVESCGWGHWLSLTG